ncbi:MAG: DHA2 family efflux MFS transporter permease subunit, partial [Starkeya sp.]|nr:DHA2 family efflux MFS transporter permease subunit [Starkeya sp.]
AAGADEISWVQTAYLMAELVMIPLSGFLARALSTRWLFVASCAMFTISSLLCGLAWSIGSIVAFRALQGFTGGAMVPLVFAVGFTLFSGKQRALIPAILGTVSVLAPALGPSAGGLITDALDWRWLFFVNVIPGLAIATACAMLLRIDKGDASLLRKIDWAHFVAMAVFLAGLEYVLEEGPRHDWLGDETIAIAAWLSLVGLVLFVERALYSPMPVVSLRPFRRPIFAFACLFNLVIGFGMYASISLVPVYLAQVRGYDALQIGKTIFVVGVAQLGSTVVAASLSQRIDMRWMIGVGLSLFALSLWLTSGMTSQWGFAELLAPQMLRGFALMLCIVPSVNMALSGVAPQDLGAASGLFNLMRNLGGAVGLALINTVLNDRWDLHLARLHENVQWANAAAVERLDSMTRALSALGSDAGTAALKRMAGQVRIQAEVMAFSDVFLVLTVLFVALFFAAPLLRRPTHKVEGGH